ncbi:MAG: DUF3127 domain-containing protein [Bacteroidales bacterium]|nr:DUF3127 domain-containing protein [Bacteroidales bacterium]
MEIQGKIIQLLPEQSGAGKNGQWRKREYVLETQDQYPRKVCFNMWGDKIDQNPVNIGDNVKVLFDLESREFNGKWYTDVKAWKIENQNAAGTSRSEASAGPGVDLSAPEFNAPPLTEDDLPF